MTATVQSTPTEQINRVFALQKQYQWTARKTTAAERIEILKNLKAEIENRADDLREALVKDHRRNPATDSEIPSSIAELDDAIANLEAWMAPQSVEVSAPSRSGANSAKITYEARGVVSLFGPWNFPVNLIFQPLTQIIAAGNTCMVRTNELTPHSSTVIAEVIRAVFSEELVAVFEGGVDVANAMLELPVDHIFFTGSPAVGKIVMAAAAKNLTSVTLELGGKNPVIIDKNADIVDAAGKVAYTRNLNSGQVCLCPENIYVHADQYDTFIAVAKGTFDAAFYVDGELNQDAQGKIINERNLDRIKGYLDDAKERGAEVVVGGEVLPDSLGVHPTILTGVPAEATIMQEEVFGPILSVFTYNDIEEVYQALHGQHKPLAMYVFSPDEEFVDDVLANTSSGGVTVNNCLYHFTEKNLPFGGVGHSGMGAYRGEHGFRELSHARSVLYTG